MFKSKFVSRSYFNRDCLIELIFALVSFFSFSDKFGESDYRCVAVKVFSSVGTVYFRGLSCGLWVV